jgi:ketosteroid isomerase-like protein
MLASLILIALAQGPFAEDEVRCTEIAFSRAVETGDLAAFEGFIDPDARFTGAQVLRGRSAVVEGWRLFFEAGGPSIEWAPDSVEVLASGDLALSQGPYLMRVPDDKGGETRATGRFFSVWRRTEEGAWKVVFDGGTPASPSDGDPFESLDYDRSTACPVE